MRGYVRALFPNIFSASEAIDCVTAIGVKRSEIYAILGPVDGEALVVDSLAPDAAALDRSPHRGGVIVAIAIPRGQARIVERALVAPPVALPGLVRVVA
jgi:hypothetical protein